MGLITAYASHRAASGIDYPPQAHYVGNTSAFLRSDLASGITSFAALALVRAEDFKFL